MARFNSIAVMLAAPVAISSCMALRGSQDTGPKPVQAQQSAPMPTVSLPAAPTPPTPAPPTPPPGPTSPTHSAPTLPRVAVNRPVTKPNTASEGAAKGATASPAKAKATPPATPPAPTLDLGSLEQRLKDTRAIGVFTKLSLKNQVDDLLGELRAFHSGSSKTPQAELRQKYDTLIIKVLTLLQNGDPQLATAVASSREALWGLLIDPKKFSQIQS